MKDERHQPGTTDARDKGEMRRVRGTAEEKGLHFFRRWSSFFPFFLAGRTTTTEREWPSAWARIRRHVARAGHRYTRSARCLSESSFSFFPSPLVPASKRPLHERPASDSLTHTQADKGIRVCSIRTLVINAMHQTQGTMRELQRCLPEM